MTGAFVVGFLVGWAAGGIVTTLLIIWLEVRA